MNVQYLFVYGWLKSTYRSSLKSSIRIPDFSLEYLGLASTTGTIFHVAAYPGYSPEGTQIVTGELYRVPEDFSWIDLDRFEHAYPLITQGCEYRRVIRTVSFEGKSVQAFIYEYVGNSRGTLIASGEF